MPEVTKRQFISFIVPLVVTMAVIICFSIVIADKRARMNLAIAKKEALEGEVAQLSKKNMNLHRLRDSLLYDPVQVEKEAREQLGYGRPKERLYRRYNFRVVDVDNGMHDNGGQAADAGEGIIKKIGMFGIFALIIAVTTGAFYATYWYEFKHRRIRS